MVPSPESAVCSVDLPVEGHIVSTAEDHRRFTRASRRCGSVSAPTGRWPTSDRPKRGTALEHDRRRPLCRRCRRRQIRGEQAPHPLATEASPSSPHRPWWSRCCSSGGRPGCRSGDGGQVRWRRLSLNGCAGAGSAGGCGFPARGEERVSWQVRRGTRLSDGALLLQSLVGADTDTASSAGNRAS